MSTSLMHISFQIKSSNLTSFVEHWSSIYRYDAENKYTDNIGKPMTEKSLRELFQWKNGTGSAISSKKTASISENYPTKFNGDKRARYLSHKQPGGAIWNIFYLHCLEPEAWPIFDQHTFRAMHFMQTGQISEIGTTNKQKYEAYELRYLPFVRSLNISDQRKVDKALFTFGQFLKLAAKYIQR